MAIGTEIPTQTNHGTDVNTEIISEINFETELTTKNQRFITDFT
jgi:hypothetical protein